MTDASITSPSSVPVGGEIENGETVKPTLNTAQRAKLALRLKTANPDWSDRGQELPKTGTALDLPDHSVEESALRVAAVVKAISDERLIVEVPVEVHPGSGEHVPINLDDLDQFPPNYLEGRYGTGIAAFSSAEELTSWKAEARPMTMSAQRVAVMAGVSSQSGTITLNPGTNRSAVIPRSAVLSLAANDRWMSPWEDQVLHEELLGLGQQHFSGIVGIKIRPVLSAGLEEAVHNQSNGGVSWEGAIAVEVLVDMSEPLANGKNQTNAVHARTLIGAAIKAITDSPRLKESAQEVQVIPRPVFGV